MCLVGGQIFPPPPFESTLERRINPFCVSATQSYDVNWFLRLDYSPVQHHTLVCYIDQFISDLKTSLSIVHSS